MRCLPLLSLCSALVVPASAFHMQFRRQHSHSVPHSTSVKFSSTSSGGNARDPFQFSNVGDMFYVGTILLGGQSFDVQLDTGSSDLWVDTQGIPTDGFIDTGATGSIVYGDQTSAHGPILFGNVTFGAFTVGQQAFISSPGSNATSGGDKGLLGLGPPGLSTISGTLSGYYLNGNSFLDNVFSFYPQDPNYITFALSRSDVGTTNGGSFTIGAISSGVLLDHCAQVQVSSQKAEIPQEFSAIDNAVALPVLDRTSNFPQWVCLLDAIVIQGQETSLQASALLDTGTSLASAPPAVVDAIYGSISGAQLDHSSGSYAVPCETKVDISFVFGGVSYPVHPIDATFVVPNTDGTVTCFSAFSYHSSGVDFLLGDAFLRNVFSLYDLGNWTTVGTTAPFVKLLSTTDATQADSEFDSLNRARLARAQSAAQSKTGAKDAKDAKPHKAYYSSPTEYLYPTSSSSHSSPISHSSPSSFVQDPSGLTRNTFIIMGLLACIILMLILLVAGVLPTRGNKGYTGTVPLVQSKYNQYSRTSLDDT